MKKKQAIIEDRICQLSFNAQLIDIPEMDREKTRVIISAFEDGLQKSVASLQKANKIAKRKENRKLESERLAAYQDRSHPNICSHCVKFHTHNGGQTVEDDLYETKHDNISRNSQ